MHFMPTWFEVIILIKSIEQLHVSTVHVTHNYRKS